MSNQPIRVPEPADAMPVSFRQSGERRTVSLDEVCRALVHFLEHHCARPLVDDAFLAAAAGETGEERLTRLLEHAGLAGDPRGFVRTVVEQLEHAGGTGDVPVVVGGVTLPYHALLAMLQVVVPGRGFKNVKRVEQFEALTNTRVPDGDREAMQQVLELFPVRLSLHTIRQARVSRAVGYQYFPFVGELDSDGEVHTWVGQFHRGIVEQMYQNRVIFIMNMACPVYCRFCFRKHKECRTQKAPTKTHVKQAVSYIRETPSVKEIVLTGGDPFMNRATLQFAVSELSRVPHVQTLRLASRAVSYYPEMFLGDGAHWIDYLVRSNLELNQRGKRLELATHFLHPDELSVEALDIISTLSRQGVPVYVQTPLVNGCNESGRELVELFNALRGAGAELHYIFMPTSPIQGNKVYWSPISQGLSAARLLRARLSDRAMPHVTTATSVGKMDWNNSGWAVELDEQDPRYIWIRTPYNAEYYDEFAPIMQIGDSVRTNIEGTLDAAFMSEIGDEALLVGARTPASSVDALEHKQARTDETTGAWLETLELRCVGDQLALEQGIVRPPCAALARLHPARVELDVEAGEDDLERALAYIRAQPAITDVVVAGRRDALWSLSRTLRVVDRVLAIPTVVTVRLRSVRLGLAPGELSRAAVARLAERNRLRVAAPRRVELEIQLLHSRELGPGLRDAVWELRRHGVAVYNNTPLLGLINDNEHELLRVAHGCRDAGVEFCNVYVAGLPVQLEWNSEHPVELGGVIDIATRVRRHGSGREVPRYVVRTSLGEVDYSIAPRMFQVDADGGVRVTLRPHDLAYYREMDPEFEWPAGVEPDAQGHPVVPLTGVTLEGPGFLLDTDT